MHLCYIFWLLLKVRLGSVSWSLDLFKPPIYVHSILEILQFEKLDELDSQSTWKFNITGYSR